MQKNKTLTIPFFKSLGKLFYAIAAADKKVESIEVHALKEIIKLHWPSIDLQDHHALKHIVFMFDKLHKEKQLSSEVCYQEFIDFKNKEKHLFSDTIKGLILQTSNAIASSFSGRNKSELIMLAKLDMALKETNLKDHEVSKKSIHYKNKIL